MSTEVILAERWEKINKVVDVFLKGTTNPAAIARATGFKRTEVQEYLNEWRSVIQSDRQVQMRAREALAGADRHYSMLMEEGWDVINQAGVAADLAKKTAGIKIVADIQQKQIDMLQKAGLIEDSEIAQQIIETERKQEVLVKILKEVVADCDHCKREVFKRLEEVTGKAEGF
jgi:hypothetical protein